MSASLVILSSYFKAQTFNSIYIFNINLNEIMKKLNLVQLANAKGSGCFKYLRRMDRDIHRGNDDQATAHFYEYLNCMR